MVAIPSDVAPYIQQAAKATGLPVSVVAAQVNQESGFRTGLVSSAGALGPYQFEPGTWAGLGFPAGQENNWPVATKAYAKYMSELLGQFGGNVRNALAAYNAGPGNVPAGYGYADSILSAAGQGTSITATPAGGGSSSGGGDTGGGGGLLPSSVTGFVTDLDKALGGLWQGLVAFTAPATWIRAAAGIAGGLLLLMGAVALAKAAK